MSQSLYHELKKIGIDEELAGKVSASLDPEYNATKKDILVMQEAIMQVQLRHDARYHELNNKLDASHHELNNKLGSSYHELSSKIDRLDSYLRAEMAAISGRLRIIFVGLIITILSVFAVNWYFH